MTQKAKTVIIYYNALKKIRMAKLTQIINQFLIWDKHFQVTSLMNWVAFKIVVYVYVRELSKAPPRTWRVITG